MVKPIILILVYLFQSGHGAVDEEIWFEPSDVAGRYCFRYKDTKMSVSGAMNYCSGLNSELAVIKDETDFNILKKVTSNSYG